MVLRRHSSTLPVRSPNRPVLVKSSRALDGRRIRPRRLVEVVRGPVALDGAEMGGSRGGVIGAVTLHDVEFDQRTGRPAVHGEVGVAVGVEVGRELDVPVGGVRWCTLDRGGSM